jgi:hypothetical protein
MVPAEHLRQSARQCRRDAATRPNRESVCALWEMAAEYERRARQADQGLRSFS